MSSLIESEKGQKKKNGPDRLEQLVFLLTKLKRCAQEAYSYRREQASKGWTHLLRVLACDIIWLLSVPVKLFAWAFGTPAHAMASLTFLYVIFAGAQWRTMRYQLGEMRSSSVQTGNTISALQDQAQSLKRQADVMIATQRAFVIFAGLIRSKRHVISDKSDVFELVPSWTNAGNSPTVGLRLYVGKPINKPVVSKTEFAVEPRTVFASPSLGPKASLQGSVRVIEFHELQTTLENKGRIFIWGWAIYYDIFPDTPVHITRFCRTLTRGFYNPTGEMTDTDDAVCDGAAAYDCTDEECPADDVKDIERVSGIPQHPLPSP